jgi:transcriptional regulator with XRE-family HTH domain
MKLQVTPEWCLAMARREGDLEVGVGPRAPSEELDAGVLAVPETRIAFGRLVCLLRRKHGLSIEQLAEQTSLDLADLLRIEEDHQHVPEPRTVYRIAGTFHLPRQPLMQLAGLAVPKSVVFRNQAVKFAARSESVQALTAEEQQALEEFVRALSERAEGDLPPRR